MVVRILRPMLILSILLLIAACSGGTEVFDESEPRTLDDEDETEVFRERYRERFQEACEEIWANSPDGNLYYAGTGYTVDDCMAVLDETAADDSFGEDEAADKGYEDGLDAAFQLSSSGKLCYGRTCWSRENLDGYDWPSETEMEDDPDDSGLMGTEDDEEDGESDPNEDGWDNGMSKESETEDSDEEGDSE